MPLREDLLDPIAEDRPGGDDVRYEAVYDQIKEARREELDLPTGGWETTRKTADWALVVKLGSDVLAKRSKDLQVAVWLAEAQMRREGYAGLSESLGLIRRLLEEFWDHLYPELDDGDPEFRASPLEWFGSRMDLAVKSVPLNRSGHTYLDYVQSRAVGYEHESDNRESREEAVRDGKLTAEDFDKGFDSTPKGWYKELVAGLEASLAQLDRLDEVCRERFQEYAPGYAGLKSSLEEVMRVATQLLNRKLDADPDPMVLESAAGSDTDAEAEAESPGDERSTSPAPPAASADPETVSAQPTSYADAAQRVVAVARFLRRSEPTSPTPYLMVRALRWGELRAGGGDVDPRLLEAPTGSVRTQLRSLSLDGRWSQLLDAAETVMATGAGRGWLDLQRYAVRACAELGAEYSSVQRAVLSELRALLADVPHLIEMTLMDDMPAANPETRSWIQAEVLASGSAATDDRADLPPAALTLNGGQDRILARALAEVKAGRVNRAVEILMRELDRETSRRGRFLRQVQLAGIMVDAGLEAVATPILEEMLELIESHRLEEWEAGTLVAQPLALLYRCLAKDEDGNHSTMQTLYLRLCRLDPVQAISVRS